MGICCFVASHLSGRGFAHGGERRPVDGVFGRHALVLVARQLRVRGPPRPDLPQRHAQRVSTARTSQRQSKEKTTRRVSHTSQASLWGLLAITSGACQGHVPSGCVPSTSCCSCAASATRDRCRFGGCAERDDGRNGELTKRDACTWCCGVRGPEPGTAAEGEADSPELPESSA